jgi:hypothetical protein
MPRRVEQVHRAALAVRASGGLAVELGHHAARRQPAGQRLAMFPVRGHDVVIGAKCCQRTDGDCFLPDIQVAESTDLAERVRLARLLLEPANQDHHLQPFAVLIGKWRIGAALLRARRRFGGSH